MGETNAAGAVADPAATAQPGQGGGGTIATADPAAPAAVDWSAHIPKDIAGEKFWEPMKGKPLGDVLKSYAEKERYIGGSIRLPSEKDTPEVKQQKLNDIFTKLGRPDSADKYEPKLPDLPAGLTFHEPMVKGFLERAHKAGFTKEQAQTAIDFYGEYMASVVPARAEARKTAEAELGKLWGANYKTNAALATRALATLSAKVLGNEDAGKFMDYLDESGLGNNTMLLRMFSALGADMKEDGLITGDTEITADGLQAELDKLTAKGTPYWDKFHPDHDAVVQKVEGLRQQIQNPIFAR